MDRRSSKHQSYNKTNYCSIKSTPHSVNITDYVNMWQFQNGDIPLLLKKKLSLTPGHGYLKYKVNNPVRVLHLRKPCQWECDERWSRELFAINQRFVRENIPLYRLTDCYWYLLSKSAKKTYDRYSYLVENVENKSIICRAGKVCSKRRHVDQRRWFKKSLNSGSSEHSLS